MIATEACLSRNTAHPKIGFCLHASTLIRYDEDESPDQYHLLHLGRLRRLHFDEVDPRPVTLPRPLDKGFMIPLLDEGDRGR